MLGCVTTVFYYQTLEFSVITISILIVSAYFKPFSNVLLGFLCAICCIALHYSVFYSFELPTQYEKYAYQVNVVVEEVISPQPPQYIKAKILQIEQQSYSRLVAPSAMLSVSSSQPLKIGDRFAAVAKLKPFRTTKNFSVFDKQLYAFSQKIFFKGKILNHNLQITASQTTPTVIKYRQAINRLFKHAELNWLYYVLLTGDKSLMDYQQKLTMQSLGLSHLLAISGLHISLVFGFTFMLVRTLLCVISVNVKQTVNLSMLYSVIGFVAVCCYVYLSDFIVSATRALLMLGCYLLLYYLAKQSLRWRSILYALVIILLVNPFYLLNPGLYFSFIAVVIIFTIISKVPLQGTHVLTKLALLCVIQCALFIGLLPLTVYFFNGVSLAGLVLNLMAIPLLSFIIMPLLLSIVLLSSVFDMGAVITLFDAFCYFLYQLLTSIPDDWRWFNIGQIDIQLMLFSYVILLLLYFSPFKWLACLVLSVFYVDQYFSSNSTWQLNVFDVGHGLMVLVVKEGNAMVYDFGPSYFNRFSRTRSILLPYIKAHNIHVSTAVLSHEDNDHGGGVGHFIAAGHAESFSTFHPNGYNMPCVAKRIDFHGLTIETLPTAELNNRNDDSCVMKISDAHYSVLFTGDISKQREIALLNASYDLSADVLISPHHGSGTSSSAEFVAAVKPNIVVHSSAYQGQWHFPHQAVVSRYQQIAAKQYITGTDGQIRIKFYRDKLVVESAREQESYWFIKD